MNRIPTTMKKTILLFLSLGIFFIAQADVSKTINVATAGTLSTILTAGEKTTVTNLTVTGEIDARDVKCMRDEMTLLAVLDLSATVIKQHTGTTGTYPSPSASYPANQIPQYSFCNPTTGISKISLETIMLPVTVNFIGSNSFRGCTGLTGTLTLPGSVTTIGDAAFQSCSGLTGSLILPNSVTRIANNAFSYCTGLTGSLTLPNSVTTVGSSAFRNCSGLTGSLILPNSVTTIDDYAFSFCSGLTSVTLGSGVTSIGMFAFSGDYNLKVINSLNTTPPTLELHAFQSILPSMVYVPWSGLGAYKATDGWNMFNLAAKKEVTIHNPTAGNLATALITAGYGPLSTITHLTVTGNLNGVDFPQMNTNMTTLTVVDISGCTLAGNALPANAFKNKTTLTSIKLPASVVSIGENAFASCTTLGTIPLSAAVTSIGNYAFAGCISLNGTLTLPAGITAINNGTFNGCIGLTGSLTLPGSVSAIREAAFQGCTGFTGNLSIPNSVDSIGEWAFYGCTGFTGKLTLPDNITTISSYAFTKCTGLSGALTIPLSVIRINNDAFYACTGFSQLTINKNVTTIGDNAFRDCTGLEKITVARSLPPTIYSNTFLGVNKETTVLEIPTGSTRAYQTADYWSLFQLFTETAMAETYNITFQIGTGGIVKENNVSMGNGSVLLVNSGSCKTFAFAPNPGYEIATVMYGGVDIKSQITNNQYTTPAVNTNTPLSITFQKIQYKISIQTGGSGVMNLYYEYGSTPSFDFTPSTGSKIQTVFYNGNNVTANLAGNVYRVPAIIANSILVVNFVSISTNESALPGNEVKVYASHSEIVVERTSKGETVSLYTLNGVELQSVRSQGARLVLPIQREGVYLVKTQSKTFKVVL